MQKPQILELEKDFKAYKMRLWLKRGILAVAFCVCAGFGVWAFMAYKNEQDTFKIAVDEKNKMQEKLEIAKVQIQKAQILNEKRQNLVAQERPQKPADKNSENAWQWSFKANELDKTDAGAWISFAKAKFALGKKDEAKRALQSFLHYYNADRSVLEEVRYIWQ